MLYNETNQHRGYKSSIKHWGFEQQPWSSNDQTWDIALSQHMQVGISGTWKRWEAQGLVTYCICSYLLVLVGTSTQV